MYKTTWDDNCLLSLYKECNWNTMYVSKNCYNLTWNVDCRVKKIYFARILETFTLCQSSLFSMFIFIDSSCTKPNHFNTFYHDHKITCSQLTLIFFDKLDKCIWPAPLNISSFNLIFNRKHDFLHQR